MARHFNKDNEADQGGDQSQRDGDFAHGDGRKPVVEQAIQQQAEGNKYHANGEPWEAPDAVAAEKDDQQDQE